MSETGIIESHIKILNPKAIVGITGSGGFIGKHLFNKCSALGYKVIALDRSGEVPDKVNYVFDLAGYGNKFTQKNKREIYRANITRVKTLLKNCLNKKSVILTSTSSVLLSVQTDYSISKSKMEDYAKEWVKETKANVIIVRPSTVIGVGENPEHLIPKLIDSCFSGELMDFVSEPTHDYIDVDDFCEALLFLTRFAEKYKGHIFNISFGMSLSNEFIKNIIASFTKRDPNIKRVKLLRKYDTPKWNVPNRKIINLGWKPRKTIFNTIREMINDYAKKMGTQITR